MKSASEMGIDLQRFDARARAALAAGQARADASGHVQVTVLHVLRALIGAETPARAFEARGGDVARAIAAADAELALLQKASAGLAYLSGPLTKIVERLTAEPDTISYERLLDECLAFGAVPSRGEAERIHRVRGASGLAPVGPTLPQPPASTTVLALDPFTPGARRAIAAAQKLADARGHVHTTLVHMMRTILDAPVVQNYVRSRRGDPVRAIEAAETELAAEPKRASTEQSFLASDAAAVIQSRLKAPGEHTLIELLHGCVTIASASSPRSAALWRIVEAGSLQQCTSKTTHPAPRAFAIRSAERGNARDTLDALDELGDISTEPPLLVARIRANVVLEKNAAAHADFVTLTGQPGTTIDELRQAHQVLADTPQDPNAPPVSTRMLAAVLDRMPPEPTGGPSPLRSFVPKIPLAEWPIEALFRVLEDAVLDPAGEDRTDLSAVLAAIEARAPDDPRTATLARHLADG